MNNSKSGLVGILSFIALTAASLGILGVASRAADASPSVSPAPFAVVRDAGAPTVSVVWTVDEVTVTPRPRARRTAAKKAAVIETSSDVCIVRPSDAVYGTTVRTCTPADMIGR